MTMPACLPGCAIALLRVQVGWKRRQVSEMGKVENSARQGVLRTASFLSSIICSLAHSFTHLTQIARRPVQSSTYLEGRHFRSGGRVAGAVDGAAQ